MANDLKFLSVDFLLQSGLLFEINRTVLHPLGLALEVQMDPEKGATIERLWDCRDDEEGLIYEKGTFIHGATKYGAYMTTQGAKAIVARKKALGYVVQTAQDLPEGDPDPIEVPDISEEEQVTIVAKG